MKNFLIIINPQNDFLDLNGSMYVANNDFSHRIANHVHSNYYDRIIFGMTQYELWYPNLIYNSVKPAPHCIVNTWGASLPRELERIIKDYPEQCSFTYKPHGTFFSPYSASLNFINTHRKVIEFLEDSVTFHICGVDKDSVLQKSVENLVELVGKNNIVLLPQFIESENKENLEACIVEQDYNCLYFE